jgi:hypothetical protein
MVSGEMHRIDYIAQNLVNNAILRTLTVREVGSINIDV